MIRNYDFNSYTYLLDKLNSCRASIPPVIKTIPTPWIDKFKFIHNGHVSIVIFDNETKVIVNDMKNNTKFKIPVSRYTGFLYAMLKWQAYYGDCEFTKKDYTKLCNIQIRRNALLEGILIGLIGFDHFKEFKNRIMEQFYSEEE